MRTLKWLVAGAAVAVIAAAFRDFERGGWLSPATPVRQRLAGEEQEEPVLGYDGMDQETLIDWLSEADLDEDTLLDIADYESRNRSRQPVISAVEDLLG